MRLLRKIKRFAAMPPSERSATITVTVLIPVVSTSLSLLGFQRTVDWVRRSAERRGDAAPHNAKPSSSRASPR